MIFQAKLHSKSPLRMIEAIGRSGTGSWYASNVLLPPNNPTVPKIYKKSNSGIKKPPLSIPINRYWTAKDRTPESENPILNRNFNFEATYGLQMLATCGTRVLR